MLANMKGGNLAKKYGRLGGFRKKIDPLGTTGTGGTVSRSLRGQTTQPSRWNKSWKL